MSIILFLVALISGFLAGRVSAKNEPPPFNDRELALQAKLTVAENLNDSLYVDLQTAKEELYKLKQGKKR